MTEEQAYDFVQYYPEHVVAQTVARGTIGSVGNTSFGRLLDYINGGNALSQKLAMTAPVTQETEDEGTHVTSFVLPAGLDLERSPAPSNRDVYLSTVPAHTAAAMRFSGRWSHKSYADHARRLEAALKVAGLVVNGPLRFARFDPPWTPWGRRRNEVVAPVRSPPPHG